MFASNKIIGTFETKSAFLKRISILTYKIYNFVTIKGGNCLSIDVRKNFCFAFLVHTLFSRGSHQRVPNLLVHLNVKFCKAHDA